MMIQEKRRERRNPINILCNKYIDDDPHHPLKIEYVLVDEEGDEDAILAVRTA